MTLTLPGDLADCDFDPQYLKRSLQALLKRLNRHARRRLEYFWKMEYQRRGACHFHLVLELPHDIPGLRARVALDWHDLVGRDQPNHLAAGTSVERAFNSARIASYLAKELGSAPSKEYQHHLPPQMRYPGRWWGHSRSLPDPWQTTVLSYSAAYGMRRAARRLATSPRHRAQLRRAQTRWLGRTDLFTGPPARSTLDTLQRAYS